MRTKILALIVTLAAALSFNLAAPNFASASVNVPQTHLWGDVVAFSSGGVCPYPNTNNCFINLSHTNPYNATGYITPGYTSYSFGQVDCFRPSDTLYSYWNGVYYAGQIRCFYSSNNVLTLYGYKH